MVIPQRLLYTSLPHDPGEGASQLAYREITGNLPTTGQRITIQAWAIVFAHLPASRSHYQLLQDLLGEVGENALLLVRLANIPADRSASMSARSDLIGETATIWVTSITEDDIGRGAILTSLDGEMIHLLAIAPYVADGGDRAVHLLERIAVNMATRQRVLPMKPKNDTMSRLPVLDDVSDSLQSASIGINRYVAPVR